MRIAIASDDGKMISNHFRKTEGFTIVDITNNSEAYESNYRKGLKMDKLNRRSAMVDLLNDCDVIISRKMERGIYLDFQEKEIEVYRTKKREIEDAIKQYLK